jgi:CPA2 family monovalent cation:H+ antiporter-2
MAHADLILPLTVSLGAALAFGYVTHRLGLSPIVGYLLAGIAIGPHTPGFVADRALAEQLAEIGVVLLMFGVGLQFHVQDLLAVRRIAVPGALAQSAAATALGALVGWWAGWGWTAGIIFGLGISVASTVVLVRVLAHHNALHTPAGHIAIGWLVVEDLFTVVALVVLPALAGREGTGSLPAALLRAVLEIAALFVVTVVLGGRVLPWLLRRVAATRSRELFTLTTLVVALGIAVGSALAFRVSMALGAFLAGMVVGRSEFSLRAATEAMPMRDAFAVLFFVSVGMLFDPTQVAAAPLVFALTAAIVLLAKPAVAFALVSVFGYPVRTGITVAIALAQIGEFSFIVGGLGHRLGLLPALANDAIVVTALVSIAANPLLYRAIGPIERWAQRHPRVWAWLARRQAAPGGSEGPPREGGDRVSHRAIIVGYGPVGRTAARLLQENGIAPTVVDLNLEVVRGLTAHGIHAVYGDATHAETLRQAGIASAEGLILSAAGMQSAAETIRLARELNPELRILARSNYVREHEALRRAGAHAVFSGEGEVALAFTELMLRSLGATAEQIDRERARVRTELDARLPDEGIALVVGADGRGDRGS